MHAEFKYILLPIHQNENTNASKEVYDWHKFSLKIEHQRIYYILICILGHMRRKYYVRNLISKQLIKCIYKYNEFSSQCTQ